jgi:putative SOS response-associated peptidase YedK
MCYSNSNTSQLQAFKERYKRDLVQPELYQPVFFSNGFELPRWPIITNNQQIRWMNWGLIPSWYNQKNPRAFALKTLNARIETLHEKAAFKASVLSKRCLVPSTGFFEFQTVSKQKIPYFIHLPKQELFSFAGIFDQWVQPETGIIQERFSIITCQANDFMAQIHNTKKRMPIILTPSEEENWLRTGDIHTLTPYAGELNAIRVDKQFLFNTPKAQEPFFPSEQLHLF